MPEWTLWTDSPALALHCARAARSLGVQLQPEVFSDALHRLGKATGDFHALALSTEVGDKALRALVSLNARQVPVLLWSPQSQGQGKLAALGFPCVLNDTQAWATLLRLLEEDLEPPVNAPHLDKIEKAALQHFVRKKPSELGLVPGDDGILCFPTPATPLGDVRSLRVALEALDARTDRLSRPTMPHVAGVDAQSVLDVILGPPRTLSDPSSKAALAAYDVPLPIEELCASASRAAAEASRIGFPVRVALASPDLRTSEHPDLIAERIENASRVRDVYRQLMSLAKIRAPKARTLGVTVSATAAATSLLQLRLVSLQVGHVFCELGFADAHGRASGDTTYVLLPAREPHIEDALSRLAAASLILPSARAERKHVLARLTDTLLRLGTLLNDFRAEIEELTIPQMAIRVDGEVEVREAALSISDAFERSLVAR